jgi:uncharacterized protein
MIAKPLPTQVTQNIYLPFDQIVSFCQRWQIIQLALFGSILRDDFRDDSDIDFLYLFAPDAQHTLFDLVTIRDELENLIGRKIDLISRKGIQSSRNYLRKNEILSTAITIYEQRSALLA